MANKVSVILLAHWLLTPEVCCSNLAMGKFNEKTKASKKRDDKTSSRLLKNRSGLQQHRDRKFPISQRKSNWLLQVAADFQHSVNCEAAFIHQNEGSWKWAQPFDPRFLMKRFSETNALGVNFMQKKKNYAKDSNPTIFHFSLRIILVYFDLNVESSETGWRAYFFNI